MTEEGGGGEEGEGGEGVRKWLAEKKVEEDEGNNEAVADDNDDGMSLRQMTEEGGGGEEGEGGEGVRKWLAEKKVEEEWKAKGGKEQQEGQEEQAEAPLVLEADADSIHSSKRKAVGSRSPSADAKKHKPTAEKPEPTAKKGSRKRKAGKINERNRKADALLVAQALNVLEVVKEQGEAGDLLGVKAVKNPEHKLARRLIDRHDYEVQIKRSGEYIRIPWQRDAKDGSESNPVLEALWTEFRPWMDRAIKNAGKSTPLWDGERIPSSEVLFPTPLSTAMLLACQTKIEVPFRAEEYEKLCAADAIANAGYALSAAAVTAPVSVASSAVVLKDHNNRKKRVMQVVGGVFPDFSHFLRAQCVDGTCTFKRLAAAMRYPGAWATLQKMPRTWIVLSPADRVQAMVNMEGAFVAKMGSHCVAICDGIVFDNDADFPFGINARGTPDAGALLTAIGLPGGILEGRKLCLLR
jgi:hypothetical protein